MMGKGWTWPRRFRGTADEFCVAHLYTSMSPRENAAVRIEQCLRESSRHTPTWRCDVEANAPACCHAHRSLDRSCHHGGPARERDPDVPGRTRSSATHCRD